MVFCQGGDVTRDVASIPMPITVINIVIASTIA